MIAAVAMALSSLSVVLNADRMRNVEPPVVGSAPREVDMSDRGASASPAPQRAVAD